MKGTLRIFLVTLGGFGVLPTPIQAQDGVPEPSPYDEVARFLAGLPLPPESRLRPFLSLPGVTSHYSEARALAEKWESYRLSQIRKWSRNEIQPRISRPPVLKYMFGGPDFVHAATLFPEVPEYVLSGMEPLGSVPDFFAMDATELGAYLSHVSYTLRSVSERSFFITREMSEDFGKKGVDGVFPILLYFSALTGHRVMDADHVKIDPNGEPKRCEPGVANAIWLRFRPLKPSPQAPTAQNLYYVFGDLSNAGFKPDRPFHKFLKARPGGIGYLKAASYLMHTERFSNVRNFLVGECDYILQDASGIPAEFLALYFDVTYYGNYVGPIDMFGEYDQPWLRRIYQSGVAKPLPFGTGYRMRDDHAIQMFGVRK